MKKRILILCLAGAFVFSFAGCGQQKAEDAQEGGNTVNEQQADVQTSGQEDASGEDGSAGETQASGAAQDAPDEADQQTDGQEEAQDAGTADASGAFWGSTMLASSVSDSFASIQDAYVGGGELVINGTYNIETEDGDLLDTSDAGEHRFTLSGSASMGFMGGESEPETVGAEEFNETLQYDLQNNPGLGLIFYVEDDVVQEIWITS